MPEPEEVEVGLIVLGEVARRLGLSTETLRKQVLNGKLYAVRRGRRHLVPEDEVDRYREAHLGRGPGNEAMVEALRALSAAADDLDDDAALGRRVREVLQADAVVRLVRRRT